MINRFMMSVAAAALIAGTGFANAQGTMGREAPSAGAPTEQHSAPAATEHTGKPAAPATAAAPEPAKPQVQAQARPMSTEEVCARDAAQLMRLRADPSAEAIARPVKKRLVMIIPW